MKGKWDLEYADSEEEKFFHGARHLAGFHSAAVRVCFPDEAYLACAGKNWNKSEPSGRGRMGVFGFALRYAAIDQWYHDWCIENQKFTEEEFQAWFQAWKDHALTAIPWEDEQLLDFFRDRRLDTETRKSSQTRKQRASRTKSFEDRFHADRNPHVIYRQLRASITGRTAMDEQVMRQVARLMANANDMLFQAEEIKEGGLVPTDLIKEFAQFNDLSVKYQKQAYEMLKAHGYDYQARRLRREAQTAAEIFEDVKEQAVALFDERALEIICPNCEVSLGYFIRHFPTIEYKFIVPKCPRCGHATEERLEALPDEVIDAEES